jgi:hypothetical protein
MDSAWMIMGLVLAKEPANDTPGNQAEKHAVGESSDHAPDNQNDDDANG